MLYFVFLKRKKKKEEKIEYSPWLQVNHVFKEYIDEEDNEEIEKIGDEIYAFKIVDLDGPMSLEKEFKPTSALTWGYNIADWFNGIEFNQKTNRNTWSIAEQWFIITIDLPISGKRKRKGDEFD